MDALFILDHPAREMQDTFYLERPKSIKLDKKLLKIGKRFMNMGVIPNQLAGVRIQREISQRSY